MNDTTNENIPEQKPETSNKSGCSSSCESSSCGSHSSLLIVAAAALLLAGYAAFTGTKSTDNSETEARIAAMESEISLLRGQVESLGKDVASNREGLLQTKIQRAITSIEEIGDIAGQETRDTIAEVEKMLRGLTAEDTPPAADTATATTELAPVQETPAAVAEPEASPAETPATDTAPTPEAEQAPATDVTPTDNTVPTPETETPATPTGPQAF
jgi:hypothetical protein